LRIKIDENLGESSVDIRRDAGHDAATVREQGLGGSTDEAVYLACRREGRALITLDRDFGEVTRFPPKTTAGIIVLEVGGSRALSLIHKRLREFLFLARTRSVAGELWIVEPGRVRVHLERNE
jgi:predicted nuclease of predicted toxin-antitoxin system